MASALCFGKDTNEYLILCVLSGFENSFKYRAKKYLKNIDYNFEDCVLKFLNETSVSSSTHPSFHVQNAFPIFILKNNIWYSCNQSTMLLIPCPGRL